MNFEHKLISLVQENKVLYDYKNKSYKINLIKDKVWEKVAKKMNCDVKDCRHRWKSLRDRFVRDYRIQIENNSDGSFDPLEMETGRSRWPYYKAMKFLADFIKPLSRTTHRNFIMDEDANMEDQSDYKSSSPPDLSTCVDCIEEPKVEPVEYHNENKFTHFSDDIKETCVSSNHTSQSLFVKLLETKMNLLPERDRMEMEMLFLNQINTKLCQLIDDAKNAH